MLGTVTCVGRSRAQQHVWAGGLGPQKPSALQLRLQGLWGGTGHDCLLQPYAQLLQARSRHRASLHGQRGVSTGLHVPLW